MLDFPPIFRFFTAILDTAEENLHVNELFRFKAGYNVQKSKRIVKSMDQRIVTIMTRIEDGTKGKAELLRGMGYVTTLNL